MSAASKQLRIPQPSRVTGQMGITRKECEENHPHEAGKWHSLRQKGGGPIYPCDRNWQGNCWTQVKGQDRIVPLSTRKVMDLRSTWSIALGSARVIRVSKSGWGQSFTRLRKLKAGRVSDAGVGEAGPSWHGRE